MIRNCCFFFPALISIIAVPADYSRVTTSCLYKIYIEMEAEMKVKSYEKRKTMIARKN